MKFLAFTLILTFSSLSFGAKSNPKTFKQNSKAKIYQHYLKENMDLRLLQEKKMYLKQLSFLKKNHEIRLKYFLEVNNLKMKMDPQNKKLNKKIKNLIIVKKLAFQKQNKKRREVFFTETVRKDMAKFKKAMVKRRLQLSAKLKQKKLKSVKTKI